MVLLDLDEFRILNETYGLIFGDVILEEIGSLLLAKKETGGADREKGNHTGAAGW